jgi:hypothetical protein
MIAYIVKFAMALGVVHITVQMSASANTSKIKPTMRK